MASTSRIYAKELVAEPFALRGAAHQPGDIDEGEPRGDHLRGLGDGREPVEPRVGNGHLADIRLDGAERIVGGLRRRALGQRVEQGGLADIGQPDDAAFESHGQSAFTRRTSGGASPPGCLAARSSSRPARRLAARAGLGARSGLLGGGLGLHRMRHARLELVGGAFGEIRRLGGDRAEQRLEPRSVRLGEIVQHVMRDQVPLPGMADADAHPHIVVADMRRERSEPVMAGDPAARLHPHLAGREIELVMEHHHVGEIELVEAHRLADGAARRVHEGPGLEQQHLLIAELAFGGGALEALAPGGKAMRRGDGVDRHEAHIVTVERVFRPGIAEADEELHRDRSCRRRDAQALDRARRTLLLLLLSLPSVSPCPRQPRRAQPRRPRRQAPQPRPWARRPPAPQPSGRRWSPR